MLKNKFNFVLLQFNKQNIELTPVINAYAMEDFFCDGIEEFSLEEARVDQILGERAYSGGDIPETLIDEVQLATQGMEENTFKYFFFEGDFEKNAENFVYFLKENYPFIPVFVTQKEIEDWNAEWKKFYAPIIVSEKLEIVPEWLSETRKFSMATKVYIYPGMGFGTGTHETTFLCLKHLDQVASRIQKGANCLDFGCGSGILGIAAMKLLELKTTFCDIDKSALDNCVQNLILNFEGEDLSGTTLVNRDRFNSESYDVVFANILEHVLILEKDLIIKSLNKDGILIVSGILNHQVESIINNYAGLEKLAVLSKNDWSAVMFKRLT